MEELQTIQSNYNESLEFLRARKLRQVSQLGLFNNLQRGDENIASTLLLTLFNRVMSDLYDDKMQVKFIPSEELDQKKVNTLNILAQNDYREMDKQVLDYDWIWDALAFGRGYCETLKFNTKRKIMEPRIINPLVFGYDPYFPEVQDWRYYWKWITKSKWDIQKLINSGFITGIKYVSEIPAGVDPELWDFKIKRDAVKLGNAVTTTSFQGDVYQILEYFGYNKDGDKCVKWIDSSFSKVLMEEKLDLRDGDDGESNWPLVIKESFREPHSSVPVSILDLLEDKHRAKSVLLNLAFMAAKDEANPIYGYNPDKVRDQSAFFARELGQHIPMDSQDASWPINQHPAMSQSLMAFITMLTQEANEPMGTGMAINPAKKKASATETAIQQQLNDLARSLQSKVVQFGEKDFWAHWYQRYHRYTQAGDTKIATIVGVKGMTFESIDLGDIRTKYPPGVTVYSAKEAEYKELVLRRDLMQLYPQFQETLGPDGMRNFNKHVFFPKFLHDPTIIDIILPKSLDEIKAEDENEQLANNKLAEVAETDEHTQHIPIHYMAKKTPATWTHIFWHEELLALKKKQEQMQAQQQAQGGGDTPKPKVGKEKSDPNKAASPLATEIKSGQGKQKSPVH